MNLRPSGKPFPLLKRIILIFFIMSSTRSENYSKNSTLNREYSKNSRNCKNSKNSPTYVIQEPSLSLVFNMHQKSNPTNFWVDRVLDPLASWFSKRVSLLTDPLVGAGQAAAKSKPVKTSDTSDLRSSPARTKAPEKLAITSSSPEEPRMRNAAQKGELMSKPYANLEALPSKNHVSTRTKTNHLNCSRPSVTWLFQGLSPNKIAHMINGNRGRSYNIGMWNCRKGLVDRENLPTAKMKDVRDFLGSNDLQVMCLIEADLHGMTSRIRRVNPITTKKIEENLKVENYRIFLPQSWQVHGQARILLYVREDLNINIKPLARENTDLPSVSCEIGVGKEKKTRVNFFYREWTSGVSGLDDNGSQSERLRRLVSHWKTLHAGGRDTIILGDANLCALKWEEETFQNKELALQIQEYMLEISS